MDIATIMSVIQTVLTTLQCTQLIQVWSIWGKKSHLVELTNVIATVRKVLLDAEAKHDELPEVTQLYIEELKDALYDADDLLGKFVTLAKRKQLMDDGKFHRKVRHFIYHYNRFGVASKISQGVEKILNKLDNIASKHSMFGLNLDHEPIRRRREETCSEPNTEIIGRSEDVEKIVGKLLASNVQKVDVSEESINLKRGGGGGGGGVELR
ncbi:hypothetical protein RND81_14G129100 [Saponaria officinalis]|uniref:Disease resistance N-terminal domain-containing protein n=1 Tax=Saponaria officinalis TaxID=3572 RepID=A0AAW1GQ78_SAPOF